MYSGLVKDHIALLRSARKWLLRAINILLLRSKDNTANYPDVCAPEEHDVYSLLPLIKRALRGSAMYDSTYRTRRVRRRRKSISTNCERFPGLAK
jgi:hypothetical protein